MSLETLRSASSKDSAHSGFFKIDEEHVRVIERTFDTDTARRKALAALMTVSRVANLEGCDTFSRSVASLAKDMAFSYRHALDGLRLLETSGIIEIDERFIPGTKERGLSTYTLLHSGTTLLPTGTRLVPSSETGLGPRVSKNSTKNSTKNSSKGGSAFAPPSLHDVLSYSKEIKLHEDEGGSFHDHFTSNGWKVGGRSGMHDWKAALRNWARRSAKFTDKTSAPQPTHIPIIAGEEW